MLPVPSCHAVPPWLSGPAGFDMAHEQLDAWPRVMGQESNMQMTASIPHVDSYMSYGQNSLKWGFRGHPLYRSARLYLRSFDLGSARRALPKRLISEPLPAYVDIGVGISRLESIEIAAAEPSPCLLPAASKIAWPLDIGSLMVADGS